jgi:hypothetical protein
MLCGLLAGASFAKLKTLCLAKTKSAFELNTIKKGM